MLGTFPMSVEPCGLADSKIAGWHNDPNGGLLSWIYPLEESALP